MFKYDQLTNIFPVRGDSRIIEEHVTCNAHGWDPTEFRGGTVSTVETHLG